MDKCNNDAFKVITNNEIYQKICDIELIINGNGKKGLKQQITSNATSLKILWILTILIISGAVGGAIGGLF